MNELKIAHQLLYVQLDLCARFGIFTRFRNTRYDDNQIALRLDFLIIARRRRRGRCCLVRPVCLVNVIIIFDSNNISLTRVKVFDRSLYVGWLVGSILKKNKYFLSLFASIKFR